MAQFQVAPEKRGDGFNHQASCHRLESSLTKTICALSLLNFGAVAVDA
ncbi:hypothetical protein COLO4_07652 [Corchorus olitorius]|uniref:Uncharacterized protein n=1 Tax=Corchorus olitorius TaxID=93759 RepID=A0A1R3KJ00_9ROSI|nr:hypothetical protein COLO4_07652 [Corchorus olitorius]